MPQQLIYTSAPRGIVAGRSGYCTVARSAAMREALMMRLERFSYYQHLSLSGGRERPIFACRVVDLRGVRYYVLSRIADAGLDFTGRTNFIAHHLVFMPDEIERNGSPPAILSGWTGWAKSWTREPALLENEDWTGLAALAGPTSLPAQTWQRVSGDAANGYGLLEARAGVLFRVDNLADDDVLKLFAEGLELLEVRGPHRDWPAARWNYTFTTSMQEQDNPADFRWRCIHSDNPAAARFATPDCRELSSIRAERNTDEEIAFARTGRQPPHFVLEPQDLRIREGENARFVVRAESVPRPAYQWYSVDRNQNAKMLAGETNPELVVSHPVLGISRYQARAANSSGTAESKVAMLSVEAGPKGSGGTKAEGTRSAPAQPVLYSVRRDETRARDRQQHRVRRAEQDALRRWQLNKISMITVTAALVMIAAVALRQHWQSSKTPAPAATNHTASDDTNAASHPGAMPPTAKTNPPPASPSFFNTANLATTNNTRPKIFAGGPWLTNQEPKK